MKFLRKNNDEIVKNNDENDIIEITEDNDVEKLQEQVNAIKNNNSDETIES